MAERKELSPIVNRIFALCENEGLTMCEVERISQIIKLRVEDISGGIRQLPLSDLPYANLSTDS